MYMHICPKMIFDTFFFFLLKKVNIRTFARWNYCSALSMVVPPRSSKRYTNCLSIIYMYSKPVSYMQRCEWMFCILRIHSDSINGNEHPIIFTVHVLWIAFSFSLANINSVFLRSNNIFPQSFSPLHFSVAILGNIGYYFWNLPRIWRRKGDLISLPFPL